jgi:hypothetical protein
MMSSEGLSKWDRKKKYRGKWWPAGSPTTSYPGALRFRDGRPRLTVNAPSVGQRVYDLHGPAVIHGELESGNKVTLWDQYEQPLHHDRSTERGMTFHRHFSYAILGQHLGAYEEELFQYSAVQLHGLAEWTEMREPTMQGLPLEELPQYPAAQLQIPNSEVPGQSYTVLVRIENPKRLEISNHSGTPAFINHMGDKVRVTFECEPPAPARVHDLLLFDLQPLLSFAYHSGVSVDSEWLAVKDIVDSMPVMRPHRIRKEYVERSLFNFNMVLPLSAVDPSLLFPAWWRAQDELYPAPQIITSYLQGTRGVLEGSVSAVIAVAEHLHSKIGPTKERFDKQKLKNNKRAVIRALPDEQDPEFIKFVNESFANNRPTLATKLSELIDAVTPGRLEMMNIDGESWAADVKQVRNLLAHTGSHVPRRSNAASELLARVNIETRAIVAMLILKQMNLGDIVLDQAAHALHVHLKQNRP